MIFKEFIQQNGYFTATCGAFTLQFMGLWLSQEDPFHVSVVVNGGSSSELLQCFQGEHD